MELMHLQEASKLYEKHAQRQECYNKALIMASDSTYHASLFFLSAWYPDKFGTLAKKENIEDLEQTLDLLEPLFKKYEGEDIKEINLEDAQTCRDIKKIYSLLSSIPGVEPTGAAKVMHLINDYLFVMWDKNIRRYYELETEPEDYLNFLKLMQQEVKDIDWERSDKSLAKAVDEYNYVKCSLNLKLNQQVRDCVGEYQNLEEKIIDKAESLYKILTKESDLNEEDVKNINNLAYDIAFLFYDIEQNLEKLKFRLRARCHNLDSDKMVVDKDKVKDVYELITLNNSQKETIKLIIEADTLINQKIEEHSVLLTPISTYYCEFAGIEPDKDVIKPKDLDETFAYIR